MKAILLGIAFILFGFVMLLTGEFYGGNAYEILGMACPVFGIMLAILGAFIKEEK